MVLIKKPHCDEWVYQISHHNNLTTIKEVILLVNLFFSNENNTLALEVANRVAAIFDSNAEVIVFNELEELFVDSLSFGSLTANTLNDDVLAHVFVDYSGEDLEDVLVAIGQQFPCASLMLFNAVTHRYEFIR